MEYEAVIGLEVHAQLLTESKLFCGCSTKFGAEPNTQACPVCLGFPGVLPVLNRRAVEFVIRMALAVEGEIQPFCIFARKSYFYPDLPKGYQISQYELPLCLGGHIDIEVDGGKKRIGLTRIHLEEDAGKLVHEEAYVEAGTSLFDGNRCGVPLLEIVSKPDIRSPQEAHDYLVRLRQLVMYLGICDGNMEEGSLRCDANVSIRPKGSRELGTKTEVKNMNSFRNVQRALEAEISRQIKVLRAGGKIEQETLLWDPDREVVEPMRSKEFAHDYRYFPEPDLIPLYIEKEWIEKVRSELPELPWKKKERLISELGLPEYDAEVLTSERKMAEYFEEVVASGAPPKAASNWVMGEVLRVLREEHIGIGAFRERIGPGRLAELLKLVEAGTISGNIAKKVFEEMRSNPASPQEIVRQKGLAQISDEAELSRIVDEVLSEHPQEVERYKGGKVQLLGFFVGQVMKKTRGKANPKLVNRLIREKLG
ncbi:MAG TPA: Asp-tRNA(Asn)/Glu-tRNA(Gln) amidotransferase subunit GatB [Candidatus Latescibacteria bacterium]|nr:Asp-tRNA(Asn)/Glu-tRNA(Gln) amidotransferase subunit GatB [Candidatus Latescibacterota bacterium]